MFSFRTTPLDRQEDLVLRRGSLAVLCNQSAWDPERQEYLFESLYRNGRLRKVLFPADGIFGEKPDRSLGEAPVYASLGLDDCMFVPLHTGPSGELSMDAGVLEDVDALIVEYQDTGSRYDSLTALLTRYSSSYITAGCPCRSTSWTGRISADAGWRARPSVPAARRLRA